LRIERQTVTSISLFLWTMPARSDKQVTA